MIINFAKNNMKNLLIKNGKVITITGDNIENGYVLIKDGKIVEFDDMEKISDAYKNSKYKIEEIDARGNFVLPGFIDAHTHIGVCEDSVGLEGADENEMTDPITPHLRAIDGIFFSDRSFKEAIAAGVTTVATGPGSANVIGGQFVAIKTHGKSLDKSIIKQPVAMKIAFGENPKVVYGDKKMMPSTRMATAALLREMLYKAKEYKESWEDYNKNREEYDKPEFDIKLDSLIPVLNKEIYVKAHAHREDDILTAIRIAKEFDINLTLEHCTEGHLIADILLEEGYPVVVGPLLTDRSKIELRNQSIKTPGILSNMGIKVAIMTDHPCVPIQYLSLSAALAVKEGMKEEDALKAITINAAFVLGIDNRVGSIDIGKDADLIIVEGHPFELMSKVKTTIINGEIVYRYE